MPQTPEDKDFNQRIGLAFAPYQVIEEYLKLCIEAAHLKIQVLLRGRIPFRYSRKDYENEPLGRLITLFARYYDNNKIIQRLRSAQTDRNYVAHKALVHYTQHRKIDAQKVWAVVRELQKELKKLKAADPWLWQGKQRPQPAE